MKNSKQLKERARKILWADYKLDNKGYKTFEDYCSPIVEKKKQILKAAGL